jgi:hypothetical protein
MGSAWRPVIGIVEGTPYPECMYTRNHARMVSQGAVTALGGIIHTDNGDETERLGAISIAARRLPSPGIVRT